MVARGLESPVDAAEYPVAGVLDLGELAVNLDRRAHDIAAECLSDRLMAQADPEHRHGLCRLGDKFEADTGVVRRAGPRRQYDGVWIHGHHPLRGDLVVAVDGHVRPQPTEIVVEVESKAVVVVDQNDHDFRGPLIVYTSGLLSSIRHARARPGSIEKALH